MKNPWNLNNQQQERLSTLVRWHSPLARPWYLMESFQLFWGYKQPWPAKQHLLKWMARGKIASFRRDTRARASPKSQRQINYG
jgi:hypothetical protein